MTILWRVCLAVLSLLAPVAANAASPITKVGVMSVLGRELDVIIYAPTTGSRVDRNAKDSIKMEPSDFENFVLHATVEGARREGLGEAVMLARPSDGSRPWQRDGQAVLVTRALLDAAQASKLSHLVLIQPARGDAKLQMSRQVAGSGKLEGLGFYVDTTISVERTDTNEVASGYLAPFAFFDMYLVDVATLDLQAEYRARASASLAEPGRQGTNPWNALSSQRKVEVIRQLIQQEVDKAMHEWSPANASSATGR